MKSFVRLLVLGTVFAVVVPATPLSAQENSPFFGTWKINLAKSKLQGPPPKSQTIMYEPAGEGIKITVDAVSATGEVVHFTYTANYDGNDNPVAGNAPDRDTTARTRIDANTHKIVNKMDGQITTSQTLVVSEDGKTLTITTTGTNPQGEPVNDVLVWNKQ